MIGALIFTYCLVCYGFCNIVIYGKGPFHVFIWMHDFLEKIHPQLNEVVSCFMCLGFWVGAVLSVLNHFLMDVPVTPCGIFLYAHVNWIIIAFLDGLFTSGACWLINTVQEYFEVEEE